MCKCKDPQCKFDALNLYASHVHDMREARFLAIGTYKDNGMDRTTAICRAWIAAHKEKP